MSKILHSPWLAVSLAIVAMTLMYVSYLKSSGVAMAANGYSCPAKHTVCSSEECQQNGACTTEACKHCEGCKNQAS